MILLMKKASLRRLIFWFALLTLLSACNLPGPSPAAGDSSARIVAPANGAQLSTGEVVTVKTRVSDPGGARQALLLVDDVAIRGDQLSIPLKHGTMLQGWQPPGPGSYTLQVQFVLDGGDLLFSDKITVIVSGESQPSFGSPPSPTTAAAEGDGDLTISPSPADVTITLGTTLTASATQTPTATGTASLTPSATITLTPTLGAPVFMPDQAANCRSGPSSSSYGVIAGVDKGNTVPIVGKSSPQWGPWWVVKVGGVTCWVYSELGRADGDLGSVPEVTAPATPTPTLTRTPIPLSPPAPLSPSGTLNCADASGGVTLTWTAVNHPNGIDHYEWELIGPFSEAGSTISTQADTGPLTCAGAVFQWRVRAIDGGGGVSQWSDYATFTLP